MLGATNIDICDISYGTRYPVKDSLNMNSFLALATNLGQLLKAKKLLLATAESCTGGEVAQAITSVPGSSDWFERGFVTYSNRAKMEMLGVREKTLTTFGAVSEQTAREMAEGALQHSHADCSLAVTGIAGPDGGTPEKPVGLVCFAWAAKNLNTLVAQQIFAGDRIGIRDKATIFTLEELIKLLK